MNISNGAQHTITKSWWVLKITYGLLFVVAGSDKFMHLVTNWDKYLSPWLLQMFPITLAAHQVVFAVGIIEIIIGLLVLTKFSKIGAYLVAVWFVISVVNLLSMGMYFDIAVRDLVMAIGAYVLVLLTDVHDEFTGSARS